MKNVKYFPKSKDIVVYISLVRRIFYAISCEYRNYFFRSFGEIENDTNGFLDRLKSTIAADLAQGSEGVGIHMLEDLKQQNSQEYEAIQNQLREEKELNAALENQSQKYILQLKEVKFNIKI